MNRDLDTSETVGWPGAADEDSAIDGPRAGRPAADPGAAVGALYAEHALSLIRLAHIMLGDPGAAEDVVQDAFCGLYRRWPYLKDQSRALGYLRSSVLNGCRSVRRSRTPLQLDDARQLDEARRFPVSPAETAVLTAEERQETVRALRSLPARQREVIALRFFLDLPDEQIAGTLRISRATVRSAAHRGLISLRRMLKETT
jgi:RNA polymerase sigma-70 factor (sigma-E family)